MPSAETPARSPWWLAVLVTVPIVAAAAANSSAYLTESQNHLEVGEFASSACQVARVQAVSGILTWAVSQHYYPPLYMTWLSIPVAPGVRPSLAGLVLWSDVLIAAGTLGLAFALWRLGGSAASLACALGFLVGGPLFNLHTKTLSFECGVMGSVGVLLALLSGPRGLPSRRGAVMLGLAGAMGCSSSGRWSSMCWDRSWSRWSRGSARAGPRARRWSAWAWPRRSPSPSPAPGTSSASTGT